MPLGDQISALDTVLEGEENAEDVPKEEKPIETPEKSPLNEWHVTLAWSGSILAWYIALQFFILPRNVAVDPEARDLLFRYLPYRFFQYSEAAFFTAAVLNLLSFIFEETPEKRQLALLSALIKALSWHCDYLIVTGNAVITFDGYGAVFVPSRYAQWSCTTPTMLFILSKISDFTPGQAFFAMLCDWIMIVSGYVAATYPPGIISFVSLIISFVTFYIVLSNLSLMIKSALAEANSPQAKWSLQFTLWSSLIIWNIFPLAWIVGRMGVARGYSSLGALGVTLDLLSNFLAKVFFSSCILYNNFVSLQQRRIAAQLEQEHKERIVMITDLKVSLRHKDEFISVVGHELRTPLNAIIQLSSAMIRSIGTPGTVEKHRIWMETITRSATHLLGIINDIITMRAARTGLNLKQNIVWVDKVVDHVMRTLTPMAKRSVVLEKALCIEKLPPIVADERRIIQVLSNVLGNALKFTERGKVEVRAYPDRGARNVVIKVKDTGCGIPRDELPSLLVPFRQANMSSGRKYGGTGLGLSIAHQLVESHGGQLEIDSREGEGTVVSIKLPVLQPETRDSLEQTFKDAYLASGYDYEQLVSVDVAKAEGRRSVVFSAHAGSGAPQPQPKAGSSSTRHSMEMDGAVVEQYNWTGEFHNSGEYDEGGNSTNRTNRHRLSKDRPLSIEEQEDHGVSAAASGFAGPPPMAVALVSSLYSSTAGNSGKLPTILPTIQPEMSRTTPNLILDHDPTGARRSRSTSTRPASPTTKQMSSIEDLELQLLQAQAALEMARISEPPPKPNLPYPAQPAPSPDFDAYNAAVAKQKEDDDVLEDYAGNWHKAPTFGDGFDDKAKDYYAYDNRMSYEYRPSMDFAADAWKSPSTPNGNGHSPSGGKVSGIIKSAVRKSIDMMRFRPSPPPPPSQAGSSPMSGAAAQAKKASTLKDKFWGVSTVTDSRTSWEVTRKVD